MRQVCRGTRSAAAQRAFPTCSGAQLGREGVHGNQEPADPRGSPGPVAELASLQGASEGPWETSIPPPHHPNLGGQLQCWVWSAPPLLRFPHCLATVSPHLPLLQSPPCRRPQWVCERDLAVRSGIQTRGKLTTEIHCSNAGPGWPGLFAGVCCHLVVPAAPVRRRRPPGPASAARGQTHSARAGTLHLGTRHAAPSALPVCSHASLH